MNELTLDEVNNFVLAKHHLTDDSRIDDIVKITGDICGLHATGIKEPYLALFARTCNFDKAQLDKELYINRSLVKIRCMRGTLHILTKEMIPIAYAATRSMVEKLSSQYAQFRGISISEYAALSQKIMYFIKGKELTIAQIKKGMGEQRNLSAVLNLMCDQGLLARINAGGSWKTRNYKYVVFEDYFIDVDMAMFSEIDGLTRLIQLYLKGFGPSTEEDIAWWLGVGKANVRKALNMLHDQTVHVVIQELESDFVMLRSDRDMISDMKLGNKPSVNLLPTLDPYLMGYKQRGRYLKSEYYDRIFDRSGNATSIILLNGKIVGVWDFADDKQPQVKLHLFEELSKDIMEHIMRKAEALGEFISGQEPEVRIVTTMVPLIHRTAGAFMSPLRDVRR
jgi:hypothetical protein